MKITVILDTFPSISETFLYTTVSSWEKAGMQVRLLARKRGQTWHVIPFQTDITYLPSDTMPAPLRLLPIILFFLGLCWYPRKLKSALRCLHHRQGTRKKLQLAARCFPLFFYQTELVYFPFGGLAVRYLEYILETDARVVFSLRGSDIHIDPLQSPYQERLQKALLSADGVHCVCNEIKERAGTLSGSAVSDLTVIYTALAPEFFDTVLLEKRKTSVDDTLEIISVGRLDWRKGFEHGIVAAHSLMRRGVNFHWRIIGDGDYRLPLQWAIRDMGLQERVFLTGPMKHQEVVQALQAADIFFHPSIHEGISNAVLEAMALGLPVVASDIGGMREAIPSDEYGLLVPARDWKSMVDALERLAKDRNLRTRMGVSASVLVRSQFTTQRQTSGFLALFRKALGQQEIA